MDHFEERQKLIDTIKEDLLKEDLAEDFTSKIAMVAENYSLTLGELGVIYKTLNKFLKKEIEKKEILKNLFENIDTTTEKLAEIDYLLEEMLENIKKIGAEEKELELLRRELETKE